MPTTALPPIAQNPAHAHVVAACQKLRQDEIENFFTRKTGSFGASLLMREVLYWFMPNSRQPNLPRTTVHRDERYWFCRSQEEWNKKHSFTRYKLETIYKRCADFLDVDHFMFAAQRRTHYSLNFEKLRALLEADEVLRDRLSSDVESNPEPVCEDTPGPVCGTNPVPSVTSFCGVVQTLPNTGDVRAVVSPVGASSTHLASRLEAQVEEIENPPELSNQKIQVMLKAAEGKPPAQKWDEVRPLSPYYRKTVGYLMIWQALFEKEYPGRKHPFNDDHIRYARELADQEVKLGKFQEALEAAWEIRGTSGPNDSLFMCRNHSRKFGLFCKHFTRMEQELLSEGML